MRFREKMWRFLQGRNGNDQMNQFLMWFCLILWMLGIFTGSHLIYLTVIGVWAWSIYRAMSRNIYKRQRENRAFMGFWRRIGNYFRLQRNKWRDRKTHVYKKCPKCKSNLRLPRITGRHTVCCPCCNNRFDVDVDGQIRHTNERETEQSAKHKDRPKVNFFVLTRNCWRDRKTHVYQKCAMCKNVLRFPKIGGNHIAKCPCCDFRFEVRIKTADTVADEKRKEEQTEPLCGERVSPIRETKTPPKNTDNRK